MNKEVISDIQGISLMIFFISGSSIVTQTAQEAGSDSWIAILLGIILSLPIVYIYARLLSLFPGKDLFDILTYVFGKFLGKGIALLYIWFSIHLGAFIIRDYGEFPVTISLPETPMIVPMIAITFLATWGVKEGIEVLGRWTLFFLILVSPLPGITMLLLIPEMDFNNIQPILYNGIKPVMDGAFSVFSFPFGETIIFLMVLSSLKSRKSSYKIYIKGLLIGGVLLACVTLTEVLVLGSDLYSATYFPSHSVASKINIGGFLQRMEVFIIISLFIASFIKISICLLAASRGIAKVFNYDDYRFIVGPIALLMLNLAYLLHDSLIEMVEWGGEVWKYYTFPFMVIMPIFILIGAEIKNKRNKTH